MSDSTPQQPPPEPPLAAPPIQPQARVAERVATWPPIVGWIAIVLGSLSTLGGMWGMMAPFIMEWISGVMPADGVPSVHLAQGNLAWNVVFSMLMGGFGVFLALCGYGLLRRRRWSINASRCWAVLKIGFTIVGTGINAVIGIEQIEAMREQDPQVAAAMPAGAFEAIAIGGACMGTLWGCALPIFLLVWFARRAIRDDFAEWS